MKILNIYVFFVLIALIPLLSIFIGMIYIRHKRLDKLHYYSLPLIAIISTPSGIIIGIPLQLLFRTFEFPPM